MHRGNFSAKPDRIRRSSLLFAHTFMDIDQNKSAFPVKECWQKESFVRKSSPLRDKQRFVWGCSRQLSLLSGNAPEIVALYA